MDLSCATLGEGRLDAELALLRQIVTSIGGSGLAGGKRSLLLDNI